MKSLSQTLTSLIRRIRTICPTNEPAAEPVCPEEFPNGESQVNVWNRSRWHFKNLAPWTLVLALLPGVSGPAAPGDLDPTFGQSGKVIAGMGGGYAVAFAAAVQADGKLILAGFENARYVRPFNFASGGDFLLARFTTNNQLDASFGDTGKVLTQVSTNYPRHNSSEIRAIRVLADGRIVVAGHSFQRPGYTDFTLARYHSDGALDTTFGTNGTGIVSTDFGQHARVNSMQIQSDGRIVVAGYVTDEISGPDGFALARYTTNGVLDPTFGSGGTVVSPGTYYIAKGVTIQSDGKIVAVGSAIPSGNADQVAVFRYTTNGVLDPEFGGGTGKVFTRISPNLSNFDSSANAVSMQLGGPFIGDVDKIVVAGTHADSSSGTRYYQAVLRYLLDGSLDSSFGNNGIVTNAIIPGTGQQHATSVNVQGLSASQRRITIGGWGYDSTQYYFTLARFNNVGTPVSTFGENGTGRILFPVALGFRTNAQAYAMTIQSGHFVLAGQWALSSSESGFAAARFTAAGLVDTNFGNAGLLVANLSDAPGALAYGIAIQPDGKIVAAGGSPFIHNDQANSDEQKFALMRFNPDGSLDSTFGLGGRVRAAIGSNDLALAVAIQPDGKIVAAGASYFGNETHFAVARYLPDGSPDTAFGDNGKVIAPFASGSQAQAVRIQADGRIVVAGTAYSPGGQQFALARFTTNGVLDTTFGSGGKTQTSISTVAQAYAMGLAADGKIVAAGFAAHVDGSMVVSDFAAARYQTNGALDFSFGSLGRATANVGGGTEDVGYAMAIQPDGKIIVAGGAGLGGLPGPILQNQSVNAFLALVRFNTNGTPDSSFGSGGGVITQVGAFSDFATAIALQPDGKIVVAGATQDGSYKFFALRYATNGLVDASFGINGSTRIEFGSSTNEIAYALALDAQGRAIVAGDAGGFFGLARLEGDFVVAPSLSISLTQTNTAVVSWPFPSTGWSLRQNTNLMGGVWSAVTEAIDNDATNNFILVTPLPGSRYFRLEQP